MANPVILFDGDDVTNQYSAQLGALEITDALNQPVTCSLALFSASLPTQPQGGELISIFDENQIYFDGVVPVETGVEETFYYFDNTTTSYRKAIRISASDYQTVLDWVNLPKQTFYYTSCGAIVRWMLSNSVLAGSVDMTGIQDGYVLPQFVISGRKFSNVVKELGAMNGFCFSLTTQTIEPRLLVANFRGLNDRPAPFSVDHDALKYELNTLKLDARDAPLVNRVTVIGGQEPSAEIQTDIYDCDGESGSFQLSKVPFYMRVSSIMQSDFSQALDEDEATFSGAVASGDPDMLQFTGAGKMFYLTAFQSREQRYSTFEDIVIQSGGSLICGISTQADPADITDIELGVWFKPDGTIRGVRDGVEIATSGLPTWNANTFYSVRVKESSLGTYVEVQGGALSPSRHWLPIQPIGSYALGWIAFQKASGIEFDSTIEEAVSVRFGDPDGLTFTVRYVLTAADKADATLVTLHENIASWLNGQQTFHKYFNANSGAMSLVITGVSNSNPVEITTELDHNMTGANTVTVFEVTGPTVVNVTSMPIEVTGLKTFRILGIDTTAAPPYISGGLVREEIPRTNAITNSESSDWNYPLGWSSECAALPTANISGLTGGSEPGSTYGTAESFFFVGALGLAGSSAIGRIIVRDPVGVDVRLIRAEPVQLAMEPGAALVDRQDAHTEVVLTVGSADEIAEQYSAQVIMEGDRAVLSFFADPDSLPKAGDQLRVAYRYGVPIKVTVTDDASVAAVASRSKVPGDKGIREGEDIDVSGKVLTNDGALRYAQQYLAGRSAFVVQGSVRSSTHHTGGSIPITGQSLAINLPVENIQRSEVVSQVSIKHVVGDQFTFDVSFGKLPTEFLTPVESPLVGSKPDALTYDVRSVGERLRFADEGITLT